MEDETRQLEIAPALIRRCLVCRTVLTAEEQCSTRSVRATRRGETTDPWLARMLSRKPRMLVAVALANRMARIVWALTTKREIYRAPALEAA